MKRCAIYTRTSSDEALSMEFNSLDAQWDACHAYIASQKHEGWQSLPMRYDDGGYSGGNVERPGLQALLKDIEQGLVDIIVVYKIDRLTRSLIDFAKLVEVMDAHNVSFVSVTQQFNTTTSMGRLMLNVLLSFAQFEREVTAERIRDKFAASKKKGMWMGGVVPYGYRVDNRKLVIHAEEAKTVQKIFADFLTEQSPTRIADKMPYVFGHGIFRSQVRQRIGHMLKNPIYKGIITHKGNQYPGLHDAIIDVDTWQQVQDVFTQETPRVRANHARAVTPALLKDMLYCKECNRVMRPSFTNKGTKQYRYYTANARGAEECKTCQSIHNIPCRLIEPLIIESIFTVLDKPENVKSLWVAVKKHVWAAGGTGLCEEIDISQALHNMAKLWQHLFPAEQVRIITLMIHKIVISAESLTIYYYSDSLLRATEASTCHTDETIPIAVPFAFQCYKGRKWRITPDVDASQESITTNVVLAEALGKAYRWKKMWDKGQVGSILDIAAKENLHRTYCGDIYRLNMLAPDIVEAIVAGTYPPTLSLTDLINQVPLLWEEQRKVLGFMPKH